MPALSWFDPEARERVRACVVGLEAQTGAEVVITVSPSSGYYRHADFLAGAVAALLALLVYLYAPPEFPDDLALLMVLPSFLGGAALSALVRPVQRLLVGRARLDECVRTAARARFVDQGISVTRSRVGILVYVSVLERRVEVVADVGVPTQALGVRWSAAAASLDEAARHGVEPFVTALAALGPLLGEAVPRVAGDVNELPDEVRP